MPNFPIFGFMSDDERAKILEKIKNLPMPINPLSIYNSADDILEPDTRTLAVDTMIILNAVQLSFIRNYIGDDYLIKPSAMQGKQSEMLAATEMILNLSEALAAIDKLDYIPGNLWEQEQTEEETPAIQEFTDR